MRTLRDGLMVLVLVVGASATLAQAQNNAQACVRLYEDRGRSGTLDAGEPFITKDVGVNLANDQGIIIKTALVDDSPQASSGLVCFTQLEAGQYTVSVASAAYSPTTDSVFVTAVGESAVPLVFDVGMERITTSLPTPEGGTGVLTPSQARNALERVFVAGIGSLFAVVVFAAIGAVLYVTILRPRVRAAKATPSYAPYSYARPDTGVYTRPPTGTTPPVTPAAAPIEPAPLPPMDESYDEDTGSYRPV
jgi:hypothetical protein